MRDLAFHNAMLTYVAEPGTFTAFVGGSSAETHQAHFRLDTSDGRPVRVARTCGALAPP